MWRRRRWMKTEEITKDGAKGLNEEKQERRDESGDKFEEDEETKEEERSKAIAYGKEKGKEEKKKKPKADEEEEGMYKDIGQLKQKLVKIDCKIEAFLGKKAFISLKLKEAEAGNGKTAEQPVLKDVAAADGAQCLPGRCLPTLSDVDHVWS